MPKWKAWSLITFFVALTGAMLWMGMAIVVRCERLHEEQVDVTLERRFLGLITVSREVIPDVTKARVVVVWNRGSGGGKVRRGSIYKLEITPRDGAPRLRTRFGPAFGTHPVDAAEQIEQFIKEPAGKSLTTWWMPSVVNIGAMPFVLIFGALFGELLLRAFGFFKPASLEPSGHVPSS